MNFQIKNRWSGAVQFECELDAEVAGLSYGLKLGFAIKKAHRTDADLTRADLTGADLTGADLTDAVLTDADLTGADLTDAVLTDADLTDAVLTRADLTRADLTDAVLTRAVLTRADLTGADLTDADLTRADLTDAVLTRADLTRADLTGADLTGADLTRADLTDAVLTDAVLTGADLTPIRDDFWAVLCGAPAEVHGLRNALIEGRVDGSTYQGDCACLVGTIANVRGIDYRDLGAVSPNVSRPAERFFMGIRRGDKPETNQFSALALEWTDQFIRSMTAAFGPQVQQ